MKRYCGNREPFVFLAYGESDEAAAERTAELLGKRTRVCGAERLGRREKRLLDKASAVILLVSEASLRVAEETAASAAGLDKEIIPVFLDDAELPEGLGLLLGGTRGIFRSACETEEDYAAALLSSPILGALRVTAAQKREGRRMLAVGAGGLLLLMAAVLLLILRPFSVRRIDRDSALGQLGLSGDPTSIRTVALYGESLEKRFEDGGVYQAYASVANSSFAKLYLPRSDTTASYGKLSDLSDFAQLVNLEELSLAGNSVEDISPLFSLKKLKKLDLSMQLRYIDDPYRREIDALRLDLTGISALENLETLYLCYDRWPEDGSIPAWMDELDGMPSFRTLVLDRGAEVIPALQGKVSYDVVLLGSEAGSYEELRAAAEDPDCHSLYVTRGAEIVIPAGEEWTLPANVMLTGVDLTLRVEGTLRVRGWMECGMTSTFNDGTVVVEKDGGFIGGMSSVYNNGLFVVEEGGIHVIERGMEFWQQSGSYINSGTLHIGWGGSYRFQDGAAENNGQIILEKNSARGGMPMPDNWFENKLAAVERFTGSGTIEVREMSEQD